MADTDAARVRAAAEQFDAGVTAFKARDYEGAASHFEAADAAVASPKALRQAIRARVEAGQGSRTGRRWPPWQWTGTRATKAPPSSRETNEKSSRCCTRSA